MDSEIDYTTQKVTVVLDKPADWIPWIFLRQDTAQQAEVWQYCDPDVEKDKIPALQEPTKPTTTKVLQGATVVS